MEKDVIKVDTCIIGGSVAGLWTGLELAKRGQNILVVDKDHIGALKHNLDVCINHSKMQKMLPIAQKAKQKWLDIKNNISNDLNAEVRGSVTFAMNHDSVNNLNSDLIFLKDLNPEDGSFIINDRTALKTLLEVNEVGEEVMAGLVSVEDLVLDNQNCLDFLRNKLIQSGAQFWGSDEIIDYDLDKDTIKGLITKDAKIETKNVILASGAKSKLLVERLGLKMPIRPAKAHLVEYTSKVKLPEQILHFRNKFGDYISKPMLNGRHLLTYTGTDDQIQATWATDVNHQTINNAMVEMMRVLPILEFADVQDYQTIQLAVTPDRMPYFGKTKHYKNLYLNIGLNGLNYLLAPYLAEQMANMLTNKKADPSLDILNPDRYMADDFKLDFESIKDLSIEDMKQQIFDLKS